MSSRDKILGRIQQNLRRGPLEGAARQIEEDYIAGHKRNIVPARAQVDYQSRLRLFQELSEALETTIDRVDSFDAVPEKIRDYLAGNNLSTEIKMSPDPSLDDIPWSRAPMLTIERGAAAETDQVSVTPAFAGIAETGTLLLASGAETPSTLNFLPENHIVVLKGSDVTGSMEQAWDKLRVKLGDTVLPRTVNMISGPSRTGDIEQRLIMGAHGPKRLHIVIVDDGEKED
jgi:L-lactate dehydrogenase complex protein LldG